MALDSEFCCDVALVASVGPHPSADRLDVAVLSLDGETTFPYSIVCGRDEFKTGDLCVYVSPDSTVPLKGPFAFLSNRLDAKGKDRYRIRSARLRGLFSPGLIIPAPVGAKLGQSLAKELGVEQYDPNGPAPPSLTAPAVKGGRLPIPDPFPVYTVLSLKKCQPFTDGEDVSITEKLHGCNFRFGYGGQNRFYYGSHRVALNDTRGALRKLTDWLRGRRYRKFKPGTDVWSAAVDKFELEDVARSFPNCVFYGELFGMHNGSRVQDLTYGFEELKLNIFDIWHAPTRRWLTWGERAGDVQACLKKLGLNYVPHIYCGPFSMAKVKELAEKNSTYGGIREGVVVEAMTGPRRKGKWVSERYHMRKDG